MNKQNKNNKKDKLNTIYKTYQVTLPLIDKLSGVIDLYDKAYANWVYSNFLSHFEMNSTEVLKCKPKGAYTLAASIPFPDKDGVFTHSVRFEMKIPKLDKAQMRFEYNPAHLKSNGIEWLDNILLEIGQTFYELHYHARFTRVDVQREILDCNPSDLLFQGKWKRISRSYTSDQHGVETLYLGSAAGNQMVIYNKKLEQGDHTTATGLSRIECSSKINLTASQLKLYGNPFSYLNIVSMECETPPFGEAHWLAFQDSCRLRGINNAVKHQPHVYQTKLKKALASNKVTWWQLSEAEWNIAWANSMVSAGLDNIPQAAPPLTLAYHCGQGS